MEKIIQFFIMAVFLLYCSMCFGFSPDHMEPSANKTADALIVTGEGFLYGIMVTTDATNSVTIKSYDNTSASGTKLHPDWVVTTGANERAKTLSFDPPVPYSTGLYIDITTAGTANYMTYTRNK